MDYDQITLELKNVINKEKGKVYSTFETRVVDMASDCLKFIEENTCNQLRSPFEWIDVDTRLPDPHEWVLVAIKFIPDDAYEAPIIAQFQDGAWYSRESGFMPTGLFKAVKSTHWSPLPKNPDPL